MSWLPGAHLLRQAWDATKLAMVTRDLRRERAVVLAQKNPVAKVHRRKEAIKEVKRLFEAEEWEELSRALLPHIVVDKALDLAEFWWRVWDIYWLFVLLRIVLAVIPTNSGYIHPDEHFQSVEVVLGDVLELDTHRTWEFNISAPLRSPSLPFLLYGLPVGALKYLDLLLDAKLGVQIFIGPYIVQLVPRLIMLALSFTVDACVYQICRLYKHNYNQCLTTLASSYVMIVYSTRTFSNTLELVMTSLLLYMVAHTMKRTDETVYLQELVQDSYKKAESVRERVEIQKKRKIIPPHDFKFILPIGILVAVGVFNRPTFVFFAFVPLFFWFQRGVSNKSMFTPFQIFNFRIAAIIPITLVSGSILLLTDSLYYGQLTLRKLWDLTMGYDDWKLAPFNFIMYNLVPGNLAQHGVHPWYTHLLVNLPMLLGPLAPIFLVSCASWVSDVVHLPWRQKPGLRTVYALTLFSALLPVIGLSLVQHQEARFLLPILPCVILMCAHKLRWKVAGWRPLLSFWYAFNLLASAWFGFLHQSGVNPIQRTIAAMPHANDYVNLVYSHTYTPPRLPLLSPRVSSEARPYCRHPNTKFLIHDLGSAEPGEVHNRLLALLARGEYLERRQNKSMSVLLVMPSLLLPHLHKIGHKSLHMEHLATSGPSISVEAMPRWEPVFWDSSGAVTPLSLLFGVIQSTQQLSLALLNVTMGQVSTVDVNQVDTGG